MPANLGGWTGLILLLVVILLFAAPKLPQLARSLGQSMTIFKKEIKNKDSDTATAEDPTNAASSSAASTTAPASAPATPATSAEGTDTSPSK